jgi:uncharacterized protein (TIGR02118 family)
MITLTVLYGRPDDPDEFERYYAEHHLPLVEQLPGLGRHEAARCVSTPDGGEPAFYRMFTAWFDSVEEMHQVLGTEQGKVVTADVPNFASGGATMVVSAVGAG